MATNWFRTSVLIAAIIALFVALGGIIGGKQGMLIAFVIGGMTNIWSYWFSDKLVLKMYKAQPVNETSNPYFFNLVKDLAFEAKLPMPKVYLIQEEQPNAFATGRNPEHAAVAATTGIVNILSEDELRGVMAHELTHVKRYDCLISTMSATVAGAISALANFALFFGGSRQGDNRPNPIIQILIVFLAPIAAMIIQMSISRTREFGADEGGAQISKKPLALASALQKIEHYAHQGIMSAAQKHPETAQMMIINPLAGSRLRGLFSTHPPTEVRIQRLQQLAKQL